jgi:hypothetical protein
MHLLAEQVVQSASLGTAYSPLVHLSRVQIVDGLSILSFCGLKCTTFLRVKVYHPEMLTFMI